MKKAAEIVLLGLWSIGHYVAMDYIYRGATDSVALLVSYGFIYVVWYHIVSND